uniref:Uncharacterized protein AlNc14C141G7258 n=1 Tax=Albugo laibachii Nc14 TaxID=890382 RepID=F0WL70_9STRA|nr:conserved hypothetical protein [Albugo laibachii Nc14]|eukprot:CCA22031.1 conserved hypothetical protein [Albugo laibachii Nc14]
MIFPPIKTPQFVVYFSMASTAARSNLMRNIDEMNNVTSILDDEIHIFSRLMYKNHSQHRRSPYFRRLKQVKRCLRDIDIGSIRTAFKDFRTVFSHFEIKSEAHHLSWKLLSTELKHSTDGILRELILIADRVSELLHYMQIAYKDLETQFVQTYFMQMALTMKSVLARLTMCFGNILLNCYQAHGCLVLLYLDQVCKSNPLRAQITAVQLKGYKFSFRTLKMVNVYLALKAENKS